jgi:hypothetical protein
MRLVSIVFLGPKDAHFLLLAPTHKHTEIYPKVGDQERYITEQQQQQQQQQQRVE